jgi:hypothetical protein
MPLRRRLRSWQVSFYDYGESNTRDTHELQKLLLVLIGANILVGIGVYLMWSNVITIFQDKNKLKQE